MSVIPLPDDLDLSESCEDPSEFFKKIANETKIGDENSIDMNEEIKELMNIRENNDRENHRYHENDEEEEENNINNFFVDDDQDVNDYDYDNGGDEEEEDNDENYENDEKCFKLPEPPKKNNFDTNIKFEGDEYEDYKDRKDHKDHKEHNNEQYPDSPFFDKKTQKESLINAEKRECLMRFLELEDDGVPVVQKFNMNSDLNEMRFELRKLDEERIRSKTVNLWKKSLMAALITIENLNSKFDPFGLKLKGLSNEVKSQMDDINSTFRELHRKYCKRGKSSPELFLIITLATCGINTHVNNSKKKKKKKKKNHGFQVPPTHFFPYPPQQPPYYPPPRFNPNQPRPNPSNFTQYQPHQFNYPPQNYYQRPQQWTNRAPYYAPPPQQPPQQPWNNSPPQPQQPQPPQQPWNNQQPPQQPLVNPPVVEQQPSQQPPQQPWNNPPPQNNERKRRVIPPAPNNPMTNIAPLFSQLSNSSTEPEKEKKKTSNYNIEDIDPGASKKEENNDSENSKKKNFSFKNGKIVFD